MILAPRLRPGDTVRVVAPSGPVPPDRFAAGIERLRSRYRVEYEPEEIFAREGYLAGPDSLRAACLQRALDDPGCQAVWMARGGYGLLRILPLLNWQGLLERPKALIGFSDGTALLAASAAKGLASIHGPVVTQMATLSGEDAAHLWRTLEEPQQGRIIADLDPLVQGQASGRLLGGNLEVFSRLIGTPFLPQLDGAILFIEDVGERPYRVDRLLTHFELSGILGRIGGALVGDFVHCDESPSGNSESPSVQQVLAERLGCLGCPVAVGGRFGHGNRNVALPYGSEVKLDVGAGSLLYV